MNLKSLRSKLDLTQAQAASLVGVSTNTWARWEQGVHRPRGAALKLIELLPTLHDLVRPHDCLLSFPVRVRDTQSLNPHLGASEG